MPGIDRADYAALDATALAALVRDGQVAPPEVLAAARAAHEAVHEQINAVLEWYGDDGEAADDGDAGRAPPDRTAWHVDRTDQHGASFAGVPVLRKDFGAAEAGRLVERGSRLSAGWRATATDPLFTRLRRAGARTVGRAAVPEFILHATTESRVHGTTRNPWNVATSAGGSSGGSAAAVAAGVVPLAHASDCAGSIRIPASVCGLVGLKPTRGRVPWGGGTVRGGGWGGIAEELVLARSVRDVQAALAVLAGPPSRGPGAADGPVPAALRPGPRPLQVALVAGHWAGAAVDPALDGSLAEAGRALEGFGHEVAPARWPVPYERVAALLDPLFSAAAVDEVLAVGAATGRPLDAEHLEPVTRALVELVGSLPAAARRDATRRRRTLTAELDRWWTTSDVVLCPTLGRASLPLGRLGGEVPLADWVAAGDEFVPHSFVANLTGWPAVSIPWGTGPDGVPIGLQLLARRGADEALLALAATLEAVAPPAGRPPVWAGARRHAGAATPGSTQSTSNTRLAAVRAVAPEGS